MSQDNRQQQYVQLLQMVLDDPQNTVEILSNHEELLDQGFLELMKSVAVKAKDNGQNDMAEFLAGLGDGLGDGLGIEIIQQDRNEKAYLQFLMQLLQRVDDSQGNPQIVYPFLQQNLHYLDEILGQVLQQWVTINLAQMPQEQALGIAVIIGEFGNLIQQFPLGQRWVNLELGIISYEIMMRVVLRDQQPEMWATIQNNLAGAYYSRIRGDRGDNIEQVIAACLLALEVRTREAFPENWATTQNNLANAYYSRIRGDRGDNIEQAIAAYLLALEVSTREAFPEDWAMTQHNLAGAYSERIRGDRGDNIEQAIAAYLLALEVRTREAFPIDWAMTQHNLAGAYSNRIKGKRADNIEAAITAFELALEVYTREAFPIDWAMTQHNLAGAYSNRIKGKRADNIEAAIAAYLLALEVRTREALPEKWATTQNNLATAYKDPIRGDRADNIEQAIAAYGQALEVRTREAFPEDWAITQLNLANAYQDRIRGDRADNIEQAIAAYGQALQVYTRDAFPEDWAMTQNNLAVAYKDRIRGDRADNIEQAIAACGQALEVRTREAFPEDWAITQLNLANAYKDRIRGDRGDNIEQAIAVYEQALEVRTREAFPEDWAITQLNLASAYSDRIRGDRAENIEEAIAAYLLVLEVHTREANPEKWAETQHNLAIAYSERIRGDRADNLEQAIAAYHLALEVYTCEAFPEKWAMTQNNLASAYSDRIRGDRSENIEEAIKSYVNALEVHTSEAFPFKCLLSSGGLGNLYFSEEQWLEAISNYELAIEAVEASRTVAISDRRRQEIITESIEVFANITRSHIELNQIDQALTYAERSKARNLTELLASRELYPKGDITPEIIEKLKQLRRQIPTLDRQLQILESNRNETNPLNQQAREQISAELKQARTELDEVLKIIQPIDPTFTLTQTVQPITFSEIQALLDDQTAILEWYITDEKTFAFLITKDQTQPILHTVETSELSQAVQKYLDLYTQTQRFTNATAKDQFETSWTALREALQFDQILSELKQLNFNKLILIPHRYLHFLPLHGLPFADGTCLLDHFPAGVSYAPSCQLLQVLERQEKSANNHFFAIKNPTQDLLFSELEVEAISDYFAEVDILDRHNASETTFRNHPNLAKLNSLHFSCHGTFDFESPLNSALLLNKEAEDNADNRLTLAEIFELSLPNCSLVTLSACETGITDFSSLGDEYIGLPSGFIYAGASAVISSLWPVSDLATAILMIKLYQNLKQDSQHIAVALNQAQYWLRNLTTQEFEDFLLMVKPQLDKLLAQLRPGQRSRVKDLIELTKQRGNKPFNHPYYWAAFTATGI